MAVRKDTIIGVFNLLASIVTHCLADLTGVDGIIESNEIPTFKPLVYDNGMLRLVLKDLAEDLILELSTETTLILTPDIERTIDSRIQGFYHQILTNPSLKNRNIAFTKTPLQSVGTMEDETHSTQRQHAMSKRNVGRMAEICSSVYEWEFKAEGETMDHRIVRLFEGQQFHIMTCVRPGAPCSGLPIRYTSECRERYTWTLAQIWSEAEQRYIWDYIAVNTSCNCAVSQAALLG
ncbi:uncharacterized protein [Amphiura filiformis]|uniref:uncharacterized protein n=1 Tax=Amphiura filiformis TaxID=82378 RepID=UPI003B22568B